MEIPGSTVHSADPIPDAFPVEESNRDPNVFLSIGTLIPDDELISEKPFLKDIIITERTSFLDIDKEKHIPSSPTAKKGICFRVGIAFLALALVAAIITLSLFLTRPSTSTNTTKYVYQPKTIVYYWTVSNFIQNLDGVPRFTLGVNGRPSFESVIEVTRGDRIILHLTNNLTVPTAIHFHGLYQRGTPFMDGPSGVTQCPIAPNQTYTYNFTTGDIDGTFFWHGHYKQHYVDGFKGPMIIHDPNDNHVDFDASPSATYSSEAMLLLSDWYHEQSEVLLERYLDGAINPDGIEPIWDSGLINGIGQFECTKNPNVTCVQQEKQAYVQTIGVGETIRLRVCNAASFAAFLFSIDGHSLTVIEVDSVDVIPYTVDSLVINIAQRYSVLVTANQPIGNYLMRAVMYHGDPWTATNIMPVGMNPTVTAILNYNKVLPAKAPITIQPLQNPSILIDTNLVPSEPKQPPPIGANDVTVLFEFEFTTKGNDTYQKAYPSVSTLKDGKWDLHFTNSYTPLMGDFLLNQAWEHGSQWIPEAASNTIFVKTGQVVDIVVRNDDAGEHPMHLHGQSFWVMDMGVANSLASIPRTYPNKNPVRRDVVSITACPYDDNGCLPGNATGFSGWTAPLNGTNVNALPEATGGASNWFGYAVLRFVADNPGIWLFHCHIEWHIAAGLVMNFAVGVPEIQQLSRPGVANQTCSSLNQWSLKTRK